MKAEFFNFVWYLCSPYISNKATGIPHCFQNPFFKTCISLGKKAKTWNECINPCLCPMFSFHEKMLKLEQKKRSSLLHFLSLMPTVLWALALAFAFQLVPVSFQKLSWNLKQLNFYNLVFYWQFYFIAK